VYDFGETLLVDCDYGYQPVPAERVTCLEADGFQNIHCKGKILGHRKKSFGFLLKLLSQTWWMLIPKVKTNPNKQQYFTDNHYFIKISWCC